jgi:hypothetical protein
MLWLLLFGDDVGEVWRPLQSTYSVQNLCATLCVSLLYTNIVRSRYDVPQCEEGKFGCEKGKDGHWIHTMNGTWTVADMHPIRSRTAEPQIANASGVKFLSIHGHCHAPTCISFELFNVDTGEKICSQRPMYGSGNSSEDFAEEGYINIAPCVFGLKDDFLPAPPGGEKGLSMSTRLYSKKVCHADYAHHGEMSLWQSYGVLVA